MVHLTRAADEGRETAAGTGLEPRPHVGGAEQLVGLYGLAAPLHRDRRQRRPAEVVLRQCVRAASHEHRVGIGEALHTRGEADGVTDRRVIEPEVAADGADDDLARVDAHAHLDDRALLPTHLLAVAGDGIADGQRGVEGAARCVLVGDRCAEEGHDPVAQDVVHCALVAVDRVHHQLDRGVHEPPCFFRINALQQFHRAAQVGEERRDLLSLALE